MGLLEAVLLGIIQGLTEFLPVSSSGHLVLTQQLLGVNQPGVTFEVLLHFGTLLAVVVWYRHEVWRLIKGGLALIGLGGRSQSFYVFEGVDYKKMAALLLLASVPTVVIALLFRDVFTGFFESTSAVGIALLMTGFVLFASARSAKESKSWDNFGMLRGLLIGAAQGLAITPGLSRSGLTISVALSLGLKREIAVKFSFLLSIPVIAGAALVEAIDIGSMASVELLPLAVGTFAAFISGIIAIGLLLKVVRRRRMECFSYYCWLVGLLALWHGLI